jgi:polar amino acid transport system substrate-binding protein
VGASQTESNGLNKELAPTGIIRAAINYNNPLLARRDAGSGIVSGLAVHLSQELARRVGVTLEVIPFEAAGKITESATGNVWDIAYLANDLRRAHDIDFTNAYAELEGTYLVPAGSLLQRIEDVDNDGNQIEVTADSAYDLFLSRQLKRAKLVRAVNTPQSIELMLDQHLDAVAGDVLGGNDWVGPYSGVTPTTSESARRMFRAVRAFRETSSREQVVSRSVTLVSG